MATRRDHKQGISGDAYELHTYGEAAISTSIGGHSEPTMVGEEHENKYKGATANDRHDMNRLGKTQELRVSRKLFHDTS
jgi:hypothetical protein